MQEFTFAPEENIYINLVIFLKKKNIIKLLNCIKPPLLLKKKKKKGSE